MRHNSKPSEKKQINLSFDISSNQSGLKRSSLLDKTLFDPINLLTKGIFPQTTSNAVQSYKKQVTQPTISPKTTKQSYDQQTPERRLFSSKRVQEVVPILLNIGQRPPKNNSSFTSKNSQNTSFRKANQKRDRLTIKTGSSIEALKDFMSPGQQQTSSNNQTGEIIKPIVQSEKNGDKKGQAFLITSEMSRTFMPEQQIVTDSSKERYKGKSLLESGNQCSFAETISNKKNSFGRGQSQHNRQIKDIQSILDPKSPISYHKKNKSIQMGPSDQQLIISTINNKQISPSGILEQTFIQTSKSLKKNMQPIWSEQKLPLSPEDTLKIFSQNLSQYERTEILSFKKIYCIGANSQKYVQNTQFNDGFDDQKGEYNYTLKDHIGYRYEILEPLGKGSFGQVVKVFDHKKQQIYALKIIRNKKKFQNQALVELNILTFIKEKDEENLTNIVKIQDFLIFRNHVCIICELLSMNLYELIKSNNFLGLSIELIRRFAIQILNALNFLYKYRIVHCDLKPENILLKQPNKSGIKVVDFGSSCFSNERVYTYIQSRYYRSPEVMLGLPYEMGIDMWSFGCIMAELYMGYPIFPGENEQEQMAYIMEVIGQPSEEFIEKCPRKKYFFIPQQPYTALPYTNSRGRTRIPNSKELKQVLRCKDNQFIDFLNKCFVWESEKRMKPLQALMHSWILEGLPPEIRIQHIKYLESEQQSQKNFQPQSKNYDGKISSSNKPPQGNQGQQQQQCINTTTELTNDCSGDTQSTVKQINNKSLDQRNPRDFSNGRNNKQEPQNQSYDRKTERPRNPSNDNRSLERTSDKPTSIDTQAALLNLLKPEITPQAKKLNSLNVSSTKGNNSFHLPQWMLHCPGTTKNEQRNKNKLPNQSYFQ